MAVVNLEVKVCKNEIAKEFCDRVFALAGALVINHPQIDVSDTRDLIYLVFEKNHAVLLQYTGLPNAQAFFDVFKIATKLNEEPHKNGTLSLLLLDHQYTINAAREPLKNLLKPLFL
jgi:GGDEF domain-containing protein